MNLALKAFIIAVACPLFLFAQGNYKPGYVVNTKGDTLHGYIDYREWISSPASVNFKTTVEEGKPRKLFPPDISFFSINGLEAYQSYTGPVSMDGIGSTHISVGRDTSFKTEPVFLKVLQKGNSVALFSYTDEVKTRLFIRENSDAAPRELIYRVYYTTESITPTVSRQVEMNEKTFIKQLYALAGKYHVLTDEFAAQIGNAGYYEQDILKLVGKINGISQARLDEEYNNKLRLHLVVGAGLNITATEPFDSYQKAGGINYSSYLPCVSIGADIFANPKTRKLVFRAELILSEAQYKSSYIYTGSPYVPVRYSYSQLWAAFTPQVIYNFYSSGNFRIYGGAGLAITFFKYSNATYDLNYADTKVSNAPINDPGFLHTSATPIMLKAGVGFSKNWGVFVNYFTPTTVSEDSYFQVKTHPILVGLNYYFE